MRHYRLDVRHTSSDLAVAIELCEDARVLARVNLIEAWGVAPFDAASLAQKVRLLQSVLDDMGVLYDAAGAATLLEDACAFMRTHPLEEVGSYDDPGSREAPRLPGGEDPEGEG